MHYSSNYVIFDQQLSNHDKVYTAKVITMDLYLEILSNDQKFIDVNYIYKRLVVKVCQIAPYHLGWCIWFYTIF
jgi:hypothetical protein